MTTNFVSAYLVLLISNYPLTQDKIVSRKIRKDMVD